MRSVGVLTVFIDGGSMITFCRAEKSDFPMMVFPKESLFFNETQNYEVFKQTIWGQVLLLVSFVEFHTPSKSGVCCPEGETFLIEYRTIFAEEIFIAQRFENSIVYKSKSELD